MKEKIYTIPVTEAFSIDCECPLCILERRMEDDCVEYALGPSLMEPDNRMQTNEKGFCKKHYEKMFNKKSNTLGLALMLDTHLATKNKMFRKLCKGKADSLVKDKSLSFIRNLANKIIFKRTMTENFVDDLIREIEKLEKSCFICEKLNFTMERYREVIFYLYFKEEDFRKLFESKKGFCLKHLKQLLQGTKKYLNPAQTAQFVHSLMNMQLDNMERIQKEVNWFTRKFEYQNEDMPWGNSSDAVPRSIEKLVGNCDFK